MSPARSHLEPAEFARTRAFPPEIETEIGEAFGQLLPHGAQVVDLGAGTGRLAHLLLAHGFAVTALDVSRPMLSYLAEHRPRSASRLRTVVGDVARPPFADGAFDVAVSAHVLHLVENWEEALSESLRILRPGGLFLRAWSDHEASDPSEAISVQWREILTAHGYRPRPGVSEDEPVTCWMHGHGMSDRRLTLATWARSRSPREALEAIRQRHYPFSCDVPDDRFPALFAELETWAAHRGLSLDLAQPRTTSFVVRIYSSPEATHAH